MSVSITVDDHVLCGEVVRVDGGDSASVRARQLRAQLDQVQGPVLAPGVLAAHVVQGHVRTEVLGDLITRG